MCYVKVCIVHLIEAIVFHQISLWWSPTNCTEVIAIFVHRGVCFRGLHRIFQTLTSLYIYVN
jgi:hypothetical protein